MSEDAQTQYADVASWELSDSLWERIEPLLPKPKSRYAPWPLDGPSEGHFRRGTFEDAGAIAGTSLGDQRRIGAKRWVESCM